MLPYSSGLIQRPTLVETGARGLFRDGNVQRGLLISGRTRPVARPGRLLGARQPEGDNPYTDAQVPRRIGHHLVIEVADHVDPALPSGGTDDGVVGELVDGGPDWVVSDGLVRGIQSTEFGCRHLVVRRSRSTQGRSNGRQHAIER
jgi:hypothetical protein